MKKKFFSIAVALLLMSSSSIASTNEVDIDEALTFTNCFGVWVFVYESSLAAGATTYEAFNVASIAFDTCVENIE